MRREFSVSPGRRGQSSLLLVAIRPVEGRIEHRLSRHDFDYLPQVTEIDRRFA